MIEVELDQIKLPENQALIDCYLNQDPTVVALKTGNRLVAEQVKYLQRAQSKLPSWFSARCVIDGLLFEQSSSEVTSRAKFDNFKGLSALDLTCGLGVDSYALSSNFQQVTSIEIDSNKVAVALYNFDRLGINNLTIKNSSAEDFCASAVEMGLRFDLIFVDPSRVDKNGKKVYSLEQSAPNVLTLMPLMRKISDKILIKLSPLFDVDECFRLFEDVQYVEIVSVGGECKEVNVLINALSKATQRTINHIVIDSNSISRYPILVDEKQELGAAPKSTERRYLSVPDVAFYKSRCVELYLNQILDLKDFTFANYIFTSTPIKNFAGQSFEIESELSYNPRKIKELLNLKEIKTATIHLRDFPLSRHELYKTLKIKEGAAIHLFFTTINKVQTCFIAKPLNNK